MTEQLDNKLVILNNKRGSAKRFLSMLNNLIEKDPVNVIPILNSIKNAERALDALLTAIEQNYDEKSDDVFTPYFESHAELDNALSILKSKYTRTPTGVMEHSSSAIGLPTISLPKFSGKITEWASFKSRFDTLVDCRHNLTEIDKFQYLLSSLSDAALDVVRGLEITPGSYAIAIKSLTERFDNVRVTVYGHVKTICHIPPIHKESYDSIRHLLDTLVQSHRSLQNLKRPVEYCDDFIIQIIYEKFPYSLQKEWDVAIGSTGFPTFEQLRSFLVRKCQQLETNSIRMRESSAKVNLKSLSCSNSDSPKREIKCAVCSSSHYTRLCPDLLKLSPNDRVALIMSKRICLNCFNAGHFSKKCNKSRCTICNGRHNTVLHVDKNPSTNPNETNIPLPVSNTLTNLVSHNQNVLLTTCIIGIKDHNGFTHSARALLDSGSQVNIMTSKLANRLNLNHRSTNLAIQGVGCKSVKAGYLTRVDITSFSERFSTTLDCYVLDNITGRIPSKSLSPNSFNIPADIKLADPNYNISSDIDLLIGAQLFWRALKPNRIVVSPSLLLQDSVFGWLINGSIDTALPQVQTLCHLVSLSQIEKTISKFWETEHIIDSNPIISVDDKIAENHFVTNTFRNDSGRFVVALPFIESPKKLGDSLTGCKRRFLNLESRLNRDLKLKEKYDEFIREYIRLGHMSCISDISQAIESNYFIPHHAVFKGGDESKIRVVFDAAFKTSERISLNDILLKGPVIQDNLFTLLLRFRCYKWVMTVDIRKMYRQFLIRESDRCYQNILYRFDNHQPISIYQLNTVTYGTKPASFLATRCLKALGDSVSESDADLARVICRDFYMDDALTGSRTEEELISLNSRLIELFATAGLELSKWCTNSTKLSKMIPRDDLITEKVLITAETEFPKVLGVYWSNHGDHFKYNYKPSLDIARTKRSILSAISRLFDPLGLIGPIIIRAKLLMQTIWKSNYSWDEILPEELLQKWTDMIRDWSDVDKFVIPRCLFDQSNSYELRGYCDASEKAYGCCIYLISIYKNNSTSRIICAKSRVSPLKTITLPRLELCAAVLLVDLMKVVLDALPLKISKMSYFSDSLVSLAWIRSCPSRWKTFVAHRVSHILNLSNAEDWNFIPGRLNPADLISRGCSISVLLNSNSWWNGPEIYQNATDNFLPIPDELPEIRVLVTILKLVDISFLDKFSNLERLIRVIAWCQRFSHNCRSESRLSGILTVSELKNAEVSLIKLVQWYSFKTEINELSNSRNIPNDSSILSLNPFLDSEGMLRVGGRIAFSKLNEFQKHPILLPKGHFVNLIVRSVHRFNGHVGAETTLALTRNRFWIINGRNVVRKVLRGCVTCFRFRPQVTYPMMGVLPPERVQFTRAFVNVGVDLFGPFHVKDYARSKRIYKVYGCVFICFSTKAVHCELVDSLSTDSFIAALKRFSSRRGLPTCIFSDNASNFVGARRTLNEAHKFLMDNLIDLKTQVSLLRIDWQFIPPRAPHFGGIWEAAVKSFKTILNKKVGSANLTFTELQNILIDAEAILNSRPLCSLSADPNDLQFLTPGHFLAFTDLRSVPCANFDDPKEPLTVRWQRVQKLQHELWKCWSKQYLTQLQQRSKWRTSKGKPIAIGDLVLIHEENVPSRLWHLGRITKVHPGQDGIIRTATLRDSNGSFLKRPVVKLSVLPINDGESDAMCNTSSTL